MTISRRDLLIGTGAVAAGASVSVPYFLPRYRQDRRPRRSRVAILRIEDYVQSIQDSLRLGLQLFCLDVKGKTVVLKPNLVDSIPGNAINTHPILVVAAAECFRGLGAKEVIVAEGPGHQRDTQLVLCESGCESLLRENQIRFVDLNRDELMSVNLSADYSGLQRLWLPRTILGADLLVSMPKVKTHHWSGVTLSMKNMFGVVPGTKYGWPKNVLHWKGIHRSILDICATVPIHFVIADGVIAMEGNGPLHGTHRHLGKIVLANDPVAADFVCARLMGLNPSLIWHLDRASRFLGNGPGRIDLIAEGLPQQIAPFDVLPEFAHLKIHA
jgi:uncharacterized protein (DUF362 family)